MPSSFAITSPSNTIALNAKGQGDTTFTVTNTSGRALRGRARLVPKNPEAAAWLKLSDDPERDFAAGATQQYVVQVAVPPTAAQGSYSFSLDMVGLDNPDENYTQGPGMSFQITAAPVPTKKPFPWWILIIAVIVLVAAFALAAIIASRRPAETPTPTVDANATVTVQAANAVTKAAIDATAAAQQAGATATAESIATALARLAAIDQAAATATAQAIASQPSVALQATNGVVTITNVSINGGGNVATLAPGSAFEVRMDYFIIDVGCPGCIDQIQIGFSTATPDQCAYSGVPGSTGVSGSGAVNLTAPTQPGVYYLGFDRSQDFSCPTRWWNGAPDASRYIAAIVVK